MKKLSSSLTNMLLVLTGITVISVALLAVVNELTKAPIADAQSKALNEALKKVLPEFTNNPVAESDTIFGEKDGKKMVNFIIYPAKNGDALVGNAVEASAMGFGGELKVLVGFDHEGNIIDYSLLAHAETPGLGSKAADWFKEGQKGNITGMNPATQPLKVSKDGGQVDAITASTITSRAFLNAVNAASSALTGNTDGMSSATGQQTDTNSSATGQHTDGNSSATTQPADTLGTH